jgi:hypothetical protein
LGKFNYVNDYYKVRYSTQLFYAGEAALQYSGNKFSFKTLFKRIEPDYKSMGLYFVLTDNQSITFEPTFNLLKSKLRFSGSIGYQHDNLSNNRLFTTKRLISSANISINPSVKYGCDISCSNYGINQANPALTISQSFADSIRLAQNNSTISLTNRFNVFDKVKRTSVFFVVSRQNLTDLNRFTSNYNNNLIWFGNISVSRTMIPRKFTYSVNLNFSNTDNRIITNRLIGPSIGINKKLMKEKIALQANLAVQARNTIGVSKGTVITFNSSFTYRLGTSHSFNAGVYLIRNNTANTIYPTFIEARITAGYALTFNSVRNEKK